MTTVISKKITDCKVVTDDHPDTVKHLHESMKRPEILCGSTFKIKTPLSDHALYITINDIVLNEGTPDEEKRPFEVFINSKDMSHYQWVLALTRVISAVFRKGGECAFLIDELKSVFNPNGGYFKKGKFMPSLVAEIGDVLETHLTCLGLYSKDDSLAVAAKAMIDEKLASKVGEDKKSGTLCDKCGEYSVVMLDGCYTCVSCGASRCG
jgi:hypothetical protein